MLAFAGLWAVPWLTDTRGLDHTTVASIASLMFLGWAIGAPVMGWLSDAIGRRKPVLVAGTLVALISLVAIVFGNIQSPGMLAVLFLINGLGASTMVTCFGLVREWNHPRNTASAVGFTNMWIVAAGAVMQPLLGVILDANWDGKSAGNGTNSARIYSADAYTSALFALIVLCVMAVVCALLIKETHCQQQVGNDQ